MLKISSSGTSNAGKKKINEDNFYMNGIFAAENNAASGRIYSDNTQRGMHFYAVFDGIGEDINSDINPNMKFHDGENAAFIAADMLARLQRHLKTKDEYNLKEYVYRFVKKTNKSICDYMSQKRLRAGASFALLCIEKNSAYAYNIGNSKIFILRDNRLLPITYNDTKAENLVMAKQISADIVRYTPDNKILTQHLGMFDNEKPMNLHISDRIALRNGDKFLICSDGICDLPAERIYQILSRDISEQEIVTDLVNEAMQNGGKDNITLIVVGVNYTDGKTSKSALLKPAPDVPTHFPSISYRSKFAFTPKLIKQILSVVGIIILFVLAIALFFTTGPLRKLNKPDEGNPTSETTERKVSNTKETTSDDDSTERSTGNMINTTEEDYQFDIPTLDPNATEPEKTTEATTQAPTAAPTQAPTAAPTAAPVATAAPTAAPVITEAPVILPPTVAPETTLPPEPVTEAPTEAPTTEATTEEPTTEAPTEAPITEAPTEPPTEAPTEVVEITDAPTEPPVVIEEETIAAE